MNKDIENIINNKIERADLPSTLYHYTSIGSFYNIITGKKIWLGNTSSMNDKEEVCYFIKGLEKALKECVQSECSERLQEFFSRVYNRLNEEYPYAMCLSTLKDNAAQWERYADNAQGVCISFNTQKLIEFFYNPFLNIGKVFYGGDVRKHRHYEILREYFNTGKLGEGFDTGHPQEDINAYIDNLLACAYMIKNPSFVSEGEVRIVILWKHDFEGGIKKSELIKNQIKSFMEIDYEKVCKNKNIDFQDMISELTLGPKTTQSEFEMQRFLINKNYDRLAACVKSSKSSLR